MTGIIIKALSGFYYVHLNGKTYECKAKGSFRNSGISPLVGDRVLFEETSNDSGIIKEILPRVNSIERPSVANVDKLFIVSAFASPEPNTFLIDKMTVVAKYNKIEPVIVFNKCDMGDFSSFEAIYEKAGFKCYTISADTGFGMEELKAELKGCTSAFTGNSGVGKSSILNNLFEKNIILTGEVSQKLGRGKHTTRHIELFALDFGGYVVDTPGFSSLDFGVNSLEIKENLPLFFDEFSNFENLCKFTGCTHTTEKGCAVLEAVASGKIEKTRHESYIQIFNELKDLRPWNMQKRK